MKRIVAAAVGIALLAVPASASLRLFFSTAGVFSNTEVNDLDASPSGNGATTALGAPSNPAVGQDSILYLWAQMIGPPSSQIWNGIGVNVHVNGGTISDRLLYNYTIVDPDFGDLLFQRWQGVNQGVVLGSDWTGSNLAAVTSGEAVSNSLNAANYDNQSQIGPGNAGTAAARRGLPKSVLLGWIRVHATSPLASVYLSINNSGITRNGQTGPEPVYFGAGDENAGLLGNSFGIPSPIADASVTPEPASLALLGLAALALRRR